MSTEEPVLRALGTARGALTATATVVTAVLGVVFLLVPSLRPLPRDKIEASVKVAALEPNVALEEWAARQYPGDPAGTLNRLLGHKIRAAEKDVTGLVVYVRLRTDGFKRRSIRLRARVYNAATKRPAETLDVSEIYPEAGQLKIDAPSRSSVQLILLDDFTLAGGRHFVRVEAYDDGGILAYADSDEVEGV